MALRICHFFSGCSLFFSAKFLHASRRARGRHFRACGFFKGSDVGRGFFLSFGIVSFFFLMDWLDSSTFFSWIFFWHFSYRLNHVSYWCSFYLLSPYSRRSFRVSHEGNSVNHASSLWGLKSTCFFLEFLSSSFSLYIICMICFSKFHIFSNALFIQRPGFRP